MLLRCATKERGQPCPTYLHAISLVLRGGGGRTLGGWLGFEPGCPDFAQGAHLHDAESGGTRETVQPLSDLPTCRLFGCAVGAGVRNDTASGGWERPPPGDLESGGTKETMQPLF